MALTHETMGPGPMHFHYSDAFDSGRHGNTAVPTTGD